MHPRLLSSILTGIWAIEPGQAAAYVPAVVNALKGVNAVTSQDQIDMARKLDAPYIVNAAAGVYEILDFGEGIITSPDSAPEGSVLVIPFTSVITKYDQECGPTGLDTKTKILNRALSNPKIKAIVLKVDSPGGEADAPGRIEAAIKASTKPVLVWGDGMIASAAYWMVAAATEIYVAEKTNQVGSIGALIGFLDYRGAFEKEGIKLHEVYATKSTEKNLPYRKALDGNYDLLRQEIDMFNEAFHAAVKTNRAGKINLSHGDPFKGAIYYAEEAEKIGLIDGIKTFEEVVARAMELADSSSSPIQVSTNTNTNTNTMKTFAEKFPKIASILGVKADANNEDAYAAADAQLGALEARQTELEQANADLAIRAENAEGVVADVLNALVGEADQNEPVDLVAEIQGLQEEIKRLGHQPGAKPTSIKGTPAAESEEEEVDEAKLPSAAVQKEFLG